MEKQTQSLSHTKKKTKSKDPCPVCEEELYHNQHYSKRVGLFDTNTTDHDVIGWMCPKCNSEFDNNDNIMYIYGENFEGGDA
mgnify:FL=1